MPSTISFNGLEKSGISHSINVKRMQQLQGDRIEATSEFELEDTDFDALEAAGLRDNVSKVQIDGGQDLLYVNLDKHPNSATVHLFLRAP